MSTQLADRSKETRGRHPALPVLASPPRFSDPVNASQRIDFSIDPYRGS